MRSIIMVNINRVKKSGFTQLVDFGITLVSIPKIKIRHFVEQRNKLVIRGGRKTMPKFTTGFTLVEALFGITIMMFALLGPLILINNSLKSAHEVRDQTIASYLAFEAIEAIRNVRDERAFENPTHSVDQDWLGSMRQCVGALCLLDVNNAGTPSFTVCGGTCAPLQKSATGYGYGGIGPASHFTRMIIFEESAALPNYHATATIRVSWPGVTPRSVVYEYHIYNW